MGWNGRCWMILPNLIAHFEEIGCENVSVKQCLVWASLPPCLEQGTGCWDGFIHPGFSASAPLQPTGSWRAQGVTSQLCLWQQAVDLELEVCPGEEWNQRESKVPVETAHKSQWNLWSGWQVTENISVITARWRWEPSTHSTAPAESRGIMGLMGEMPWCFHGQLGVKGPSRGAALTCPVNIVSQDVKMISPSLPPVCKMDVDPHRACSPKINDLVKANYHTLSL